ncbi:MAG: YihY/virulence factor BrkB family protein [Corynebacterium sp.]|nr:YihY/virulence factor BrkB family protein [Corynebacterium sp.]
MSNKAIVYADCAEVIEVSGYGDDNNPLGWDNRLTWPSWVLVAKRVVKDFFADGLMDRAATLTFFTLLAFAPTVLAAYSIATIAFASHRAEVERVTADFIESYIPSELTAQAHSVVDSIVGTPRESTIALIISIVVSLFSASGYVRAFSRTSNMVYGRVEGRGIVRTWFMMWVLTIVLVVGSVVVIFSNLLRDTFISNVVEPIAKPLRLESFVDSMLSVFLPIWDWLRLPVTVIVLLTLIALLYHFSPNVSPPRFRWITLGGCVTLALGIAVWKLFSIYLRVWAGMSAYGALSTVMAVLMAMWVVNIGLVLGVKIDAEVVRAKELQAGLRSQRFIQAPPRSDQAARKQADQQDSLEKRANQLRQRHKNKLADATADDKAPAVSGGGGVSASEKSQPVGIAHRWAIVTWVTLSALFSQVGRRK